MADIPKAPPAPPPVNDAPPSGASPEPEKELYTWSAPARLYKKRNREFYTTVGALVLLVSIILLFAREFLLIGVIIAFGFVAYALAAVKPESLTHTFTNRGVKTGGKYYLWSAMSRFWWDSKWHQDMIYLQLPGQFPPTLILLLGQGDKKKIESITSTYLIKEKPAPTWLDNASKWLQEKVPLESDDAPAPEKKKATA